MVTGRVLRRHAGGYLVHSDDLSATFQCPVRARLKKEGVSVVTGDLVELDEVEPPSAPAERGTGVIAARLPRRNLLTRPYLANLDQVFIVQAMHQPEWNALLCDRYLVHLQLELDAVKLFVCVNKVDLASDEEIAALRNIYEPLGYAVIFASAKTTCGLDQLRETLAEKTTVLIGPSGVGKSSLINAMVPNLNLKVDVNEDLLVGRHTTTYSELYTLAEGGWMADTPGFSIGELEYPDPTGVAWQFPEMSPLVQDCKYSSNCLHLVEDGCNVLAHLDTIAPSRFASYATIVADAQAEAKIRHETSKKVDRGTVKVVGGKHLSKTLPRLNERLRSTSRRKGKQGIGQLTRNETDQEEQLETDAETQRAMEEQGEIDAAGDDEELADGSAHSIDVVDATLPD